MDDFQLFFRNQNPLDMEKFISKVYFICGNTPTDFHPRQHLHLFQPLPKGDTYPVFSQYPKLLVDTNVDKLKRIQLEEKAILSQEVKLLKELQEREEQRVHAENAILKQKYLNELEKAYKYAVKIEEDKVSRRYNDLLNLKKDVMNASLDENVERLESEGKNHVLSDCCLGGNPKNEEENEKVPLSREILHTFHSCPLERKLRSCTRKQNELSPLEGVESASRRVYGDEIHFNQMENEEHNKFTAEGLGRFPWKGKHKISPSEQMEKEVPISSCVLVAESTVSPTCKTSHKHEKKRWEIRRSTSSDHFKDFMDANGFITKNRSYDFSKAQEAIDRGLETRFKICRDRMAYMAF